MGMFVTQCDFHGCQSKGTDVEAYSGTTGHFLWNVGLPGTYFVQHHFNQNGTVFASANGQTDVAIRNGQVVWTGPNLKAVLIAKDGNTYFHYDNNVPPFYEI